MSSRPKHVARRPIVFVQPKKGQSIDAIVDAICQPIIDDINADRKARGLPPLPKEDPPPSAGSRRRSPRR